MMPPRYRTICADPPWQYAAAATKADASRHYETMSLGAIMALRDTVTALADDDAHLWLWTTNAFIEEGYDVVRAWGFRPLTLLTWCKKQPGVGYYIRNSTEHCILASRGVPMVPDEKPSPHGSSGPAAPTARSRTRSTTSSRR